MWIIFCVPIIILYSYLYLHRFTHFAHIIIIVGCGASTCAKIVNNSSRDDEELKCPKKNKGLLKLIYMCYYFPVLFLIRNELKEESILFFILQWYRAEVKVLKKWGENRIYIFSWKKWSSYWICCRRWTRQPPATIIELNLSM